MPTPASSTTPARDPELPVTASRTRSALGSARSAVRSVSRPTAIKALVAVGLATSVAAAVAVPVGAAPEQVALTHNSSAAFVARDRATVVERTTSRSTARSAVSSRSAVTAPAAPAARVEGGVAGVTAVAKPKPKPKPAPAAAPKATQDAPQSSSTTDSDSDSGSESRSTTSSSSGSGVSMAFYGWCNDKGLGSNASKVCSAVRSSFGITNIGGFRAGAGDHGTGKAVDVMTSNSSEGDAVAQWAIANMGSYNITYVIWQQRIWLAGASGWRAMEDRGDPTQNHMDHVHISVE